MVALGPTPAEAEASLCGDGLCNVVPLAGRRLSAVCVLPNCGGVTDTCCNNANSQPSKGLGVGGPKPLEGLETDSHAGFIVMQSLPLGCVSGLHAALETDFK